jgi:hypothetical protein
MSQQYPAASTTLLVEVVALPLLLLLLLLVVLVELEANNRSLALLQTSVPMLWELHKFPTLPSSSHPLPLP